VGAVLSTENPAQGRLLHRNRENRDFLGLILTKRMHALFEKLKKTPFPEMGKVVGDFALYDSLMAGTASSYLDGAIIHLDAVPVPDQETVQLLNALQKKAKLAPHEADFLSYAQLLDELRTEIIKAAIERKE
jgi:hypothetical protein